VGLFGPESKGIERNSILAPGALTSREKQRAMRHGRPKEFHEMMQSLLAERFHLAPHRESRETPAYVLVTDKSGPKVTERA
jgi:uncharacterized protein (TIGR03435 family)